HRPLLLREPHAPRDRGGARRDGVARLTDAHEGGPAAALAHAGGRLRGLIWFWEAIWHGAPAERCLTGRTAWVPTWPSPTPRVVVLRVCERRPASSPSRPVLLV